MLDIEGIFDSIVNHKGVAAVIVLDEEGVPLRSTLKTQEETNRYAKIISNLLRKGKSMIRDLDPQNNMKYLRVKTSTREIIANTHNNYTIIVLQNLNVE